MDISSCKLPGGSTIATGVCISLSLKLICVALNNGSIHLLNSDSCAYITDLRQHNTTCLWSLAIKNEKIVAGGVDGTLQVWDLNTRKCTHILGGHTDTVRSIQILSPTNTVISGSKDSTIRVWDLSIDSSQDVFIHPKQGPIRTMALAQTTVFAGTYGGNILAWDLVTGECQNVMEGHEKGRVVNAIEIDAEESICVSGAADGRIIQWDMMTRKPIKTIMAHGASVSHLKVRGNSLISASSDGITKGWNLDNWSERWSFPSHEGPVTTLAFNGKHVITGGVDGRIILQSADTGTVTDLGFNKVDGIWKVGFLGTGILAVGREQEDTRVWALPVTAL